MEIILKKKTVNRSKPKATKPKAKKLKQKQHHKYWPQDFVNKKHSLADIIEAKLSTGWHDDEYDEGKDW